MTGPDETLLAAASLLTEAESSLAGGSLGDGYFYSIAAAAVLSR